MVVARQAPADWTPDRVGKLGKWLSGGTPSMANPEYWDGGIPWVSPKDMKRTRLVGATDHVTQKALGNGARLAPAHALLLVVRGMILAHTFPVARAELSVAFNQDIKALVPRDNVDSEFLLWWFTYSQALFLGITTESTHGTKRLPTDALHRVDINLPPLPEQRAIAAALSDVDTLLDGLTRLIAKKRDLKRAAIQQLLAGRTRLPGFSAKWETRRVTEMGDVLAGKALNVHGLGALRPYLRTKNVLDGQIDLEDVLQMPMTDPEFNRFRIEHGDVLLNEGQSIELVGRCAMYRGELGSPCAMQNQLLRFRASRNTVPAFAEHLFRWCQHAGVFAAIATQTTSVAHLGSTRFSALRLPWPIDPKEQEAIATALSDMDTELRALEARREKTQALKQAMMQELLTGKTRLVEPTVFANAEDFAKTSDRQANIHFKRSVLAAEIVDRLHEEPTFGHVKFEKTIFLVEHLCAIDTGSSYHRYAAGPYDNRAMRSIDSQLRKQKWFDAQEHKGRYRYVPMAKRGGHKEYFERYFGGVRDSFERTLSTLRTFDTERCEIIATLFAAWNDLMKQHASVCGEAVVHEVLNNWHESKKRIPEERWRKALSWMRDKGFVPHQATGELS